MQVTVNMKTGDDRPTVIAAKSTAQNTHFLQEINTLLKTFGLGISFVALINIELFWSSQTSDSLQRERGERERGRNILNLAVFMERAWEILFQIWINSTLCVIAVGMK